MINSYYKRMHKLLAAILAISLSISMTACGEEESDGLDTPAETQVTTTTTATQKTDTSETDSSEAEITTTTATTQSSTTESTPEDDPNSNNVDSSITPYEVEMGFTPSGDSYNTFLFKIKNNMHIKVSNRSTTNMILKTGEINLGTEFKSAWEKEHNIKFTELTPENCKKNSEYLVSSANTIENCKFRIEDGIYVSKFTYNGTEYKMRLGRADKYSEKEIQAYQRAMRIPTNTTYFFMSYENDEYIVYPIMYTYEGGIKPLIGYAIIPVWELIGEPMTDIESVLDATALDDNLDLYLAEQPDWVD